ncbi:MAG: polysaccharide biosynthesis C-terminal domain-containing protein [Rhizobiales bacterium]|nr:polysaccharide biosynthesis C-terminal domain-containing protein [Hyphomicrobiales bacterium]
MRHVVVLATTASIGLVSIFAVELVDLYFLSMLENQAIVASLAFASAIIFFNMSFSIGLSIAMSATVAKAIGAKEDSKARSLALNNFIFSTSFTTIIGLTTWVFRDDLLVIIGATGESLGYASQYLKILLPSLPLLSLAMSGGGLVRAMGSPKLAMFAMLSGSVVNLILDPILIFGFEMGIEGAAWASVAARLTIGASALYLVYGKHDFAIAFSFSRFKAQMPIILIIAVPTMATMLATPFANAFMTVQLADFGESYMAGWSLAGRVAPVVFGVIFALSGAIGPIYEQNFGARKFDRVRRTLLDSIIFVVVYCLFASTIFYLSIDYVVLTFEVVGDAEKFMRFVAIWIGPSFLFYGMLFVANAAFNNLGYPLMATAFNFGKASIGTVPFVLYGAYIMGAKGVFLGNAVGNIFFGMASLFVCLYVINKLAAMNDGKGPAAGFRKR